MDSNALRAEIARKGFTLPKIAEAIGIGKKAMYEKLSGKTEFKRSEMKALKDVLDISDEKVTEIFFAE